MIGEGAGVFWALLGGLFAWWLPFNAESKSPGWAQNKFFQIPIFMLLGLFFGFQAYGETLPLLYSSVMGKSANQMATVTGWHSGSKECSGPLIDGQSTDLITRICMPGYDPLPNGTRIMLQGFKTGLGLDIVAASAMP